MSESNIKTGSNTNSNNNRPNKPEIQRYSVAKGKYSSRLNTDKPSSGISLFSVKKNKKKILFKEILKTPILVIIIKINIIIMIPMKMEMEITHLIMRMITIIIHKDHNENIPKQKQNQLKMKLKKVKHHAIQKMQVVVK